jgi:hypothetical protein
MICIPLKLVENYLKEVIGKVGEKSKIDVSKYLNQLDTQNYFWDYEEPEFEEGEYFSFEKCDSENESSEESDSEKFTTLRAYKNEL